MSAKNVDTCNLRVLQHSIIFNKKSEQFLFEDDILFLPIYFGNSVNLFLGKGGGGSN